MAELDEFELEALAASAKRAKMHLDWATSALEEAKLSLAEVKETYDDALKRFSALEKYLNG